MDGNVGSLWIVGTGIAAVGQITLEAKSIITNSDIVFSLVADPLTAEWVDKHAKKVISLQPHYAPGKERLVTYHEMVEQILRAVRSGNRTCAIFYGHPGVFVYPSHVAIERARREGFTARMFPAVSAEDCLFADLGIDPARQGCLTFEATSYLIHRMEPDPSIDLVLWQVGVIGRSDFRYDYEPATGLRILTKRLMERYDGSAMVALYQAAHYPFMEPRIEWLELQCLPEAEALAATTLFVPHQMSRSVDTDMLSSLEMLPR